MSRSFQRPGPDFWPRGAAKSMMRATAQSLHETHEFRKRLQRGRRLTIPGQLAIQHGCARAVVVIAVKVLSDIESVRHDLFSARNRSSRLTSVMSPEMRQLFAMVWTRYIRVTSGIWPDRSKAHHSKVPRSVLAPVAHRVENRAARGIQRAAHVVVSLKGDKWGARASLVVTVVVLCLDESFSVLG
jgi:hypothetical protein